jgi:peptidoglycan hydrolase CwlO-like protein
MSTVLLSIVEEKINGWDSALLDAQKQKAELEKKLARMSATIKVIQKMIEDGEPWPDYSADATRN